MKAQFLTGAIATTLFAIGSAISAPSASAVTLESCSTTYISIATACQYVNPRTNQLNDQGNGRRAIDVNDIQGSGLSFFGPGDIWKRNSDYFDNGGYGKSGHLSLSDIHFNSDSVSELMLVFKGGNRTTLTGFLVGNDTQASFNYSEPWKDFFGKAKDISHISVYYREGTQAVPTPAAVIPALFGMGVAAIRKRKNDADTQDA